MSPLGGATIVLSLAFLLAGIAWPQGAEALLRMFVASLALGFVAVRTYRAGLPVRTVEDSYSPFDGSAAPRPPAAAPEAIRELTEGLAAADDEECAERTPIPWPVRRRLVQEASRRLSERHGLRLDEPDHHPRIRSLVSEATWLLLRPPEPESGPGSRSAVRERPVPLSRLDLVLDDLERL